MSDESTLPDDRGPGPHRGLGRLEAGYRWAGWIPGVIFLALALSAPNLWLGLALGLFGASQVGHWVTERAEAACGRKLMAARYAEVTVAFVAVLFLGVIGLAVWARDGFPGW